MNRSAVLLALVLISTSPPGLAVAGAQASEEAPASALDQVLSAVTHGRPILNVNFRWEYAKINTFQHSHAATARTRFGFETKRVFGVAGLLEGVNTASPKPSAYFDGVETNADQSLIADPERTDLNRFWLSFEKQSWAGLAIKVGRQRVEFDDERWIGNVGWRQNEQTHDAIRLQTNLGHEKLSVQYLYAWRVNRIFADKGLPITRDFGPRSHMLNAAYEHGEALKSVFFVYLIDPDDSALRAFGSNTYGTRFSGVVRINDDYDMLYRLSYAHQTDGGNNPTSYNANYVKLESGIKARDWITVLLGYEILGSDTDAAIVTPFATAHGFNGFADAFLTNGGARGLRDVYVSIVPAIPVRGLKVEFLLHQFYDDQGGDDLGVEADFVARYALNEHISVLYKVAYYDGGERRSPSRRVRSMLQTTFRF